MSNEFRLCMLVNLTVNVNENEINKKLKSSFADTDNLIMLFNCAFQLILIK